MKTAEPSQLRKFFGTTGCEEYSLYLPVFSGAVSVEPIEVLPRQVNRRSPLPYRGETFAARDTRAASYVASLLSREIRDENIHWEKATAYRPGLRGTLFMFGSRSNQAMPRIAESSKFDRLFRFDYSDKWSIRAGGHVFSISAPDKLGQKEYERQTDFGVIARINGVHEQKRIFVLAGLGSRATEGCGYYLSHHWQALASKFGEHDFALVLRFQPPLDPTKSDIVAELQSLSPNGEE